MICCCCYFLPLVGTQVRLSHAVLRAPHVSHCTDRNYFYMNHIKRLPTVLIVFENKINRY